MDSVLSVLVRFPAVLIVLQCCWNLCLNIWVVISIYFFLAWAFDAVDSPLGFTIYIAINLMLITETIFEGNNSEHFVTHVTIATKEAPRVLLVGFGTRGLKMTSCEHIF